MNVIATRTERRPFFIRTTSLLTYVAMLCPLDLDCVLAIEVSHDLGEAVAVALDGRRRDLRTVDGQTGDAPRGGREDQKCCLGQPIGRPPTEGRAARPPTS